MTYHKTVSKPAFLVTPDNKLRSHLAQPFPDNPTRETIFSPDFPAPDEGGGLQ